MLKLLVGASGSYDQHLLFVVRLGLLSWGAGLRNTRPKPKPYAYVQYPLILRGRCRKGSLA